MWNSSGAPAPSRTVEGHPLLLGQRGVNDRGKLKEHVSVPAFWAAGVRLGEHHVHEAALASNRYHHFSILGDLVLSG